LDCGFWISTCLYLIQSKIYVKNPKSDWAYHHIKYERTVLDLSKLNSDK